MCYHSLNADMKDRLDFFAGKVLKGRRDFSEKFVREFDVVAKQAVL